MSPDLTHGEFARENEEFADSLLEEFDNKFNWVVTVRFYSYLHFVEKRLQDYGYSSNNHDNRKNNILNCNQIDSRARAIYRALEDLGRDARYECYRMDEDDLEVSREKLQKGKEILNFTDSGDVSTKYST